MPVDAIDSVRLVRQLIGLGDKQNGFQFGSAYAGRFALKPYGSAKLFINVKTSLYIAVYARTGVVILNAGDSVATERLFATLPPREVSP